MLNTSAKTYKAFGVKRPKKSDQIDEQIRYYKQKIKELEEQKKKVVLFFTCKDCFKKTNLRKCDLLISYFFQDFVYSDGYKESEQGIICPKCKTWNRCLSQESQEKYIDKYQHRDDYYRNVYKKYSNYGVAESFKHVKDDEEIKTTEILYKKFVNI